MNVSLLIRILELVRHRGLHGSIYPGSQQQRVTVRIFATLVGDINVGENAVDMHACLLP